LAPIDPGHDRDTWASPGVAVKLAGGARLTRRVVDVVCVSAPLVPVTVRESAKGTALVVVFMVRVEEPEPVIEAGLKPPLVTPDGKGDSLSTVRVTGPAKPVMGVTVTVNVVAWPGLTICAGGLAVIEKSGVGGVTVIVRVGGLGSEFPSASMTVREVT
jgi:hypothetical protein